MAQSVAQKKCLEVPVRHFSQNNYLGCSPNYKLYGKYCILPAVKSLGLQLEIKENLDHLKIK